MSAAEICKSRNGKMARMKRQALVSNAKLLALVVVGRERRRKRRRG